MAENQPKQTLFFRGERVTWISPVSLVELLDLKAAYPKAPLVVGNTSVGMCINDQGSSSCFSSSVHEGSGATFVVLFASSSLSLYSSM